MLPTKRGNALAEEEEEGEGKERKLQQMQKNNRGPVKNLDLFQYVKLQKSPLIRYS